MPSTKQIFIYWFRRDLRLNDNVGLFHALKDADQHTHVLPIFIFDTHILGALKNPQDFRLPFIHHALNKIKQQLQQQGSDLLVLHGTPEECFTKIFSTYRVHSVYCNHDIESYANTRDQRLLELCQTQQVQFKTFKDHVIFEKSDILTDAKKPYTIYTPYKRKWLQHFAQKNPEKYPSEKYTHVFLPAKKQHPLPTLPSLGFAEKDIGFYPPAVVNIDLLKNYAQKRDYPSYDATSKLGVHLRFGTVSVRDMVRQGQNHSDVWLSELIWREFFMQILFHYPHVEKQSFRPAYDNVAWRHSTSEFERWCHGETGYPLVDAGMRELNHTGHMHNRVRMLVASFLTKHLLMYWHAGERYFARQLLDYELASNNGNWQWAAGTGCDAAPYFRIFNPSSQIERFDKQYTYIKKWVPEWNSPKYPKPMVEHHFARERALAAFKKALSTSAK